MTSSRYVPSWHVKLDAAIRRGDIIEVHTTIWIGVPSGCRHVDTWEAACGGGRYDGAVVDPNAYHILIEHQRRTAAVGPGLKDIVIKSIGVGSAKVRHISGPYSMPRKPVEREAADGREYPWSEHKYGSKRG